MMPLLPLLLQLAGTFGPTLAGMLIGPQAAAVSGTVIDAARQVFGSTDPVAIEQAVRNNPELANVFIERIKADTEQYKAALEDVQAARSQTVQLAGMKHPIAWGAPAVSIVVVAGFIALLTVWIFHPPSSDPALLSVLNIMIGTLATAFGAVVQYWLGSSAGSSNKDAILSSALVTAQQTVKAVSAPVKK